jgi:hypothetical protein
MRSASDFICLRWPRASQFFAEGGESWVLSGDGEPVEVDVAVLAAACASTCWPAPRTGGRRPKWMAGISVRRRARADAVAITPAAMGTRRVLDVSTALSVLAVNTSVPRPTASLMPEASWSTVIELADSSVLPSGCQSFSSLRWMSAMGRSSVSVSAAPARRCAPGGRRRRSFVGHIQGTEGGRARAVRFLGLEDVAADLLRGARGVLLDVVNELLPPAVGMAITSSRAVWYIHSGPPRAKASGTRPRGGCEKVHSSRSWPTHGARAGAPC